MTNPNEPKKDNIAWKVFKFVLAGIAVLYIGYYFRKYIEIPETKTAHLRSEIRKVWRTLKDEGELTDKEKHPSGNFIIDLKVISSSQQKMHESDWNTHIKGLVIPTSDNDLDKVLLLVEGHRFLSKKHHKKTYEIANLLETQKQIDLVGTSKIVSNYPDKLDELLYSKIDLNMEAAPIAMFNGYSYLAAEHSATAQYVPHLNLSVQSDRDHLRQVALTSDNESILALAEKKTGFVVLSYTDLEDFQTCFATDVGQVNINSDNKKCIKYVNQYLKIINVLQKKMLIQGDECRLPTVLIDGVNYDPCKADSEFTANLTCKSTVDAYLRKIKKNPEKKFKTHLGFIEKSCKEYVMKVRSKNEQSMIFGTDSSRNEK